VNVLEILSPWRLRSQRWAFAAFASLAIAMGGLSSCDRPVTNSTAEAATAFAAGSGRKVLILGIDGMDPKLLAGLIDQGRMPHFAKLAAEGTFVPLETSAPPQSPVAWSNFITGAGPGTHQIYDFIHRDPSPPGGAGVMPYLSTSRVDPPERDWGIPLGQWRIPLFGGNTVLLRQGPAFWDYLVDRDIDTTVYRVPANYPPPTLDGAETFRCLCGMGTPDLLGSYGEFTFFTPNAPGGGKTVSGGRFARLRMRNHRGSSALLGPPNFLRHPDDHDAPRLAVEVEVVRDPEAKVAKITLGDEVVLLNEKEWSDWVPVVFETGIPGTTVLSAMQLPTSINAIVRFYLKQVHPEVEIYASPLNIDPADQANPVGTPEGFPEEIANACGRFYTTGIPEDTKALRCGALTEDEYLAQVKVLEAERLLQYRYALERFEDGCLFFYFGHVDQLSHIFWRDRDPEHPAYVPDEGRRYGTVIEDAYLGMDERLGEALAVLDEDDTILVMSDHGFTSFRRGLNLNTWLAQEGYLSISDASERDSEIPLDGVDWSKTRAYALGLNALYLNRAGREAHGVVEDADRGALLKEIGDRLLALRDENGLQVVETVYVVENYYPGADPAIAPDMLVGYADTFRGSWDTALGGTPAVLLEDNDDRWSGDHCIAHQIVPGIFLTNRDLVVDDPNLTDLAPTILAEFGIPKPAGMTGRVLVSDPQPKTPGPP
jgi:predicted AlkP superfamily phosphohydrolase/phosphomutase